MSILYKGQLEVDHERGVIYFHSDNPTIIRKFGTQTLLRLCSLPKPIPRNVQIDITHMVGVNFKR